MYSMSLCETTLGMITRVRGDACTNHEFSFLRAQTTRHQPSGEKLSIEMMSAAQIEN